MNNRTNFLQGVGAAISMTYHQIHSYLIHQNLKRIIYTIKIYPANIFRLSKYSYKSILSYIFNAMFESCHFIAAHAKYKSVKSFYRKLNIEIVINATGMLSNIQCRFYEEKRTQLVAILSLAQYTAGDDSN